MRRFRRWDVRPSRHPAVRIVGDRTIEVNLRFEVIDHNTLETDLSNFSDSKYQLDILGQSAEILRWEGGDAAADVISAKVPDHLTRKQLGPLKYQQIKIEASLDPCVLQWVSDAIGSGRRTISELNISLMNENFDVISNLVATDCTLKEVEFPARSWKTSREKRGVILTIEPDTTRKTWGGGGQNRPKVRTKGQWIGEYGLRIEDTNLGPGGAETYGGIVWNGEMTVYKRTDAVRHITEYKNIPAGRPVFQIEVPLRHAKGLETWFQQMVDRGSSKGRRGELIVRRESGKGAICEFDLGDLELLGITKTPTMIVADLACEEFRMQSSLF